MKTNETKTTNRTEALAQAVEATEQAVTAWTAVVERENAKKATKAATKKAEQASADAQAAVDVLAETDPDGEWGDVLADVLAVRSASEAADKAAENLKALRKALREATAGRGMAATLNRYKPTYKTCVAASGAESQNNGDVLAEALEGKTPEEVMEWAEKVLGLEPGTLAARYERLNPGQKRMNSGNRVRAALKRGDVDVGAALAALS